MGMPKRNEISKEQANEIEEARKKNKDKNVEKRLRALTLHAEGETRESVAAKTGYVKSYVSELVSKFCNKGIEAVTGNHYKGNRRNLSLTEEATLLEGFMQTAEVGQVVGVSEIKQAYEKAIGRTLENSRGQIYRVMKRHGWRKVMPRSKHPDKASDEEIESSKKLRLL